MANLHSQHHAGLRDPQKGLIPTEFEKSLFFILSSQKLYI